MKFPVAIVNFKVYEEGILANALRLARICERVSLATGAEKHRVWLRRAEKIEGSMGGRLRPCLYLSARGCAGRF